MKYILKIKSIKRILKQNKKMSQSQKEIESNILKQQIQPHYS